MSFGSFKIRKPGLRQFLLAGVWTVLIAPLIVAVVAHATLTSKTTEADYDLLPVQNVTFQQPMAMLLLSRDDKLFLRAFSDYSDVDGDGTLDTTYTDTISYAGYFDPNLCYTYDSGEFYATDQVAGAKTDPAQNNHICGSSNWSGNFLNWVAMSRIDEERYVLYGGRRVTDTTDATVLQRAYIPNDGHAWVKIYTDNGSFTPYTGTYSFCNATIGTVGVDSSTDTAKPLLRVAQGSWPTWAASNYTQCMLSGNTVNANDPSKGAEFPTAVTKDFDVLVKVCGGFSSNGSTIRESFCTAYSDGSGNTTYKPTGLLQAFASKIRFGLMTGTWQNPRSGGVLRRNIGLIQDNGGDETCTDARNEIDEKTGQFCYIENGTPAMAGIINTLDNFRVYGWTPTANNDQQYSDCAAFGIQNRQASNTSQSVPYLSDPGLVGGSKAYQCSEWGNPLAGMYAEALRYIRHFDSDGATVLAPTATFTNGLTLGGDGSNASTTGGGGESANSPSTTVPNLPAPKWLDPYSSTDGDAINCAQCNIVVLSTGEPSFDGNANSGDRIELPTVPGILSAYEATSTKVGNELDGKIADEQYLVGRFLSSSTDLTVGTALSADTSTDQCVQTGVSDLGLVRGICPEDPSTEGSYYLAGLAYEAWTNDMRPDLDPDNSSPHYIKTYTIQLSEPLPSFDIFTNDGANKITVIPGCTVSDTSGATTSSRRCGFLNLRIGPATNPDTGRTYGLPTGTDADGSAFGSYTVYWSDSPYGSHYGVSAVQVISYCVGSACNYTGTVDGSAVDVQAYMCKQQNGKDPTTPSSPGNTGNATICSGGSIKQNQHGNSDVLVRTEMVYHANNYTMNVGYSELGKSNTTLKNQFWPGPSGTSTGTFLLGTAGDASNTSSNTVTTYDWGTPQIRSYPVGPAQQILLPNPLFLAAKYGGFTYTSGTTDPLPSRGDASDWDAVNNTTNEAGQDGLPDNYFYVSDPDQLSTALKGTFLNIVLRAGSGTAAAVVANHVNGIGVAYRSTYLPFVKSSDTSDDTSVSWAGTLDTLWVDSYGLLRENGKAGAPTDCSAGCQLSSDYTVDPIVVFTTDATSKQPEFQECVPNDPTTFDPSTFSITNTDVTCSLHDLSALATIWNAESQLWGSFSDLTTNRAYSAKADTGRYIFTDLYNSDTNTYQQMPFVWNSDCTKGGFCGSYSGGKVTGNYGYLNTDGNADEAENIVNWVRGVEVSGMRSRTITTSCAAFDVPGCPSADTSLTLRLGDIVDSTPLVVTSPSENYDLIYGDTSYAKFRSQYASRRQMVYVGANDGMLHAFNGGFFDASKHRLDLAPQTTCDSNGCSAEAGVTEHPLGSEMWAYVPGSLLPHLRWLTDTAYKTSTSEQSTTAETNEHVFYVDGSPVATDAKVFPDDATHPGGWGTILVVPFRLGGGDIKVPVPLDSSQSYDPTNCDNTSATNCYYQESFPSYVVLDVTDPEQAPTVLAELSPGSTPGDKTSTSLGTESYTTSEPAFAVVGEPNDPHFFMFLGSGPTGPITTGTSVTSTQALRVYAYDLACLTGQGTGCPASPNTPLTISTKDGNAVTGFDFSNGGTVSQGEDSFAGDLIASDFDLDGNAEAVYFGSVRDDKTDGTYSGSLWKISLNGSADPTQWTGQLMYDPKAPITIRPTLGLNSRGAPMVYAGTGRLLDGNDQQTDDQQYIFGMIDPYLLPTGDAQLDFQSDPVPSPMLAASDLVDITNIGVCVESLTGTPCENNVGGLVNTQDTSTATPSGASSLPSDITTFSQLQQLFDCPKTVVTGSTSCPDAGKAGFVLDLSRTAGSPSERVVSAQALLGGVLVTNTYTPDTKSCTALGTGKEYAVDFETGTANAAATLLGVNDDGTGMTNVSLGPGIPSAPSLHAGAANQSNSKTVTACTQTSTGAIICQKVASIYPVTSGEVSWREPLDK